MRTRHPLLFRLFAAVLSGILFLSDCISARLPFLPPPILSRPLSAAASSVHFSKQTSVLLIQDIHRNEEAQRDISRVVADVVDSGSVDVIAVEGAFGPIDVASLRSFPREKTIRAVADAMLLENKISGAVHAALLAARAADVIGIDDKKLYDANVRAYLGSLRSQPGLLRRMDRIDHLLRARKAALFGRELAAFDRLARGYREGRVPLGDYALALAHFSAPGSPAVETFLAAVRMERLIDFKIIGKQRAALLAALVPKLTQDQLRGLAAPSTPAGLCRALRQACLENGISWAGYPEMLVYERYISAVEAVEMDPLLAGLEEMETAAYSQLTVSPEQRELVASGRRLELLRKLVNFTLTRREWRAFRDKPASSFVDFYRLAEARDRAIAGNVLKILRSGRRVALVAGGFHSAGVAAKIRGEGYAAELYTPKMTKVDSRSGSAYLSAFTREKTPLELFLASPRLSLADAPCSPAARMEAGFRFVSTAFFTKVLMENILIRWLSAFMKWSGVALKRDSSSELRIIPAEGTHDFLVRDEGPVVVLPQPKTAWSAAGRFRWFYRFNNGIREWLGYEALAWRRWVIEYFAPAWEAMALVRAAFSPAYREIFIHRHGLIPPQRIEELDAMLRQIRLAFFLGLLAGPVVVFAVLLTAVLVHARDGRRNPAFPWTTGAPPPAGAKIAVSKLKNFILDMNIPHHFSIRMETINELDHHTGLFTGNLRYRAYASVTLPGPDAAVARSKMVEAATIEAARQMAAEALLDELRKAVLGRYPEKMQQVFPFAIEGEEFTVALHQCAIYLRWPMPVFQIRQDDQGRILNVRASIRVPGLRSISSTDVRVDNSDALLRIDGLIRHFDLASKDLLRKIMTRYPELAGKTYVWSKPNGSPDYYGTLERLRDDRGFALESEGHVIQQVGVQDHYRGRLTLTDPAGVQFSSEKTGGELPELFEEAAAEIAKKLKIDRPKKVPALSDEDARRRMEVKKAWQPLTLDLGNGLVIGLSIQQALAGQRPVAATTELTDEQRLKNLLTQVKILQGYRDETVKVDNVRSPEIDRLKLKVKKMGFSNMVGLRVTQTAPTVDSASPSRWGYLVYGVGAELDVPGRPNVLRSKTAIADDPAVSVGTAAKGLLEMINKIYPDVAAVTANQHLSFPEYPFPVKGAQYKSALLELMVALRWKQPRYRFVLGAEGEVVQTQVMVEVPAEGVIASGMVSGQDQNLAAKEMLLELARRYVSRFFDENGQNRTRKLLLWRRSLSRYDYYRYAFEWVKMRPGYHLDFEIGSAKEKKVAARVWITNPARRFWGANASGADVVEALNSAAKKLFADEKRIRPDFPAEDPAILMENYKDTTPVELVSLNGPVLIFSPPKPRDNTLRKAALSWNLDDRDGVQLPEAIAGFMRLARARGALSLVIVGEPVRNMMLGLRGMNVIPLTAASPLRTEDLAEGHWTARADPVSTDDVDFDWSAPSVSKRSEAIRNGVAPFRSQLSLAGAGSAQLVPGADFWGLAGSKQVYQAAAYAVTPDGQIYLDRVRLSVEAMGVAEDVFLDSWGGAHDLRAGIARFVGPLAHPRLEDLLQGFQIKNEMGLEWDEQSPDSAPYVRRLSEKLRTYLGGVNHPVADRAARESLTRIWKHELESLFRESRDPLMAYDDLARFKLVEPLNQLVGGGRYIERLLDSEFYRREGLTEQQVEAFLGQFQKEDDSVGKVRRSRQQDETLQVSDAVVEEREWYLPAIPTPSGKRVRVILGTLEDTLREEFPDARPMSARYRFEYSSVQNTIAMIITVAVAEVSRRKRDDLTKWHSRGDDELKDDDDDASLGGFVEGEVEIELVYNPLTGRYVPADEFAPVARPKTPKPLITAPKPVGAETAVLSPERDRIKKYYHVLSDRSVELERGIVNILKIHVNERGVLDRHKTSVEYIDSRFDIAPWLDNLIALAHEAAKQGVQEVPFHMARWAVLSMVVEVAMNPSRRLMTVLKSLAVYGSPYLLTSFMKAVAKGEFLLTLREGEGGWDVDLLTDAPAASPDLLSHMSGGERHVSIPIYASEIEIMKMVAKSSGLLPLLESKAEFSEALALFNNNLVDAPAPKPASSLGYHVLRLFFRDGPLVRIAGVALVLLEWGAIYAVLHNAVGGLIPIWTVLGFGLLFVELHVWLSGSEDRWSHVKVLALYAGSLPFLFSLPDLTVLVLALHMLIDTRRFQEPNEDAAMLSYQLCAVGRGGVGYVRPLRSLAPIWSQRRSA